MEFQDYAYMVVVENLRAVNFFIDPRIEFMMADMMFLRLH